MQFHSTQIPLIYLIAASLALVNCSTAIKKPLEHPSEVEVQTLPAPAPAPEDPVDSLAAPKEILIDHRYFLVSYNKDNRLPNWVSYRLLASNLRKGVAQRRNRFFADPTLSSLKVPYAKPTDFDGKIYDRGHLAPSEDFVWEQKGNDETFVMTNMTPQKRKLNRGAWKSLETKVRNWACAEGELVVISGPILNENLRRFPSGVSIPERFFKIVIDETAPRKAIAFIFTQDDKMFNMNSAAVSMADAETLAGFNFEKESGLETKEYRTIRNHFSASDWTEGDCVRKLVQQKKKRTM